MIALGIAEGIATFFAVLITVNMLGNLRAYRPLRSFAAVRLPAPAPFVSLLVPARDEERAIGACVRSLLAQDYPAFEVIVLDDGSTDGTAAIIAALAREDARLTVCVGTPLPPGWTGKAHACAQLAEAARGDVLIFTDADTVHHPTMARSVVGAVAGGADVVTAFPAQEIGGWSEALTVPFMLFVVWAFLPVGRVWSDPSPRFAAANGQLLAFTRAAYVAVGGHAAVRASILDDVHLAQLAKRARLRLRLADGTGAVRTRMYRSFAEVWRGFSKNAYALLGASVAVALPFALLVLLLYLAPVGVLIAGGSAGKSGWLWRWVPLLLVALMLVQRGILAARARLPLWQGVVHPLSVLCFLIILANAVRWHRRGFGEWKGRVYATSPVAPPPAPAADTASTPRQ